MRALLVTVGSRGDAEPFISLATTLVSNSVENEVDLFIQPEMKHLVPNHGRIIVHELPFTQMDFYKYVAAPEHGADHDNPRVKFLGVVSTCISRLVIPSVSQVETVAKLCHVFICSSLAKPLMFALSEKLQKPLVVVNLQPLTPTEEFPHYSHTDDFLHAISTDQSSQGKEQRRRNIDSYLELEEHQFQFLKESMDELWKQIGIADNERVSSLNEWKLCLSGNDPKDMVHIAECFSNAVIPAVSDGGPNIHTIGPLADSYIPENFDPPADLVTFLDGCDKDEGPVCIGYGSMPFDKLSIILSSLELSRKKAILVGDALKIREETQFTKTHIFQIGNIPYPWLLPKCSMMFCHGGAGVMNACLRAGTPAIVSPLMGDQFVHARLLDDKGLGVACATMPTLTQEDIVTGITKGLACQPSARELGQKIRSGRQSNAVGDMAALVESIGRRQCNH